MTTDKSHISFPPDVSFIKTHSWSWFRNTNEQKHHWANVILITYESIVPRKSQRSPCALKSLNRSVQMDVAVGGNDLRGDKSVVSVWCAAVRWDGAVALRPTFLNTSIVWMLWHLWAQISSNSLTFWEIHPHAFLSTRASMRRLRRQAASRRLG